MSQELLQHVTRLTQRVAALEQANEALAARVTNLEQPMPPPIDAGFMPAIKRGPGRPRKDASNG